MEKLSDAQFAAELLKHLRGQSRTATVVAETITWSLRLEEVPRHSQQQYGLMGFSEEIARQMEDAYQETTATVMMWIPENYKWIFENYRTNRIALRIMGTIREVLETYRIEFAYFRAHYTESLVQREPRTDDREEESASQQIHNQAVSAGKPGSSNLIVWKHLRFRSEQEVLVAQALDRFGVLFMPNCKTRLGNPDKRQNREPDFLVCHNRKWGILEIDHETTHPASRTAQDHERDRLFKTHGIRVVEHYENVDSLKRAHEVVEQFLTILHQTYE